MPKSNKQPYSKYAKFSAIAFQWIFLFVGLSLGGNYLDEHFGNHFPGYTLIGVFLALFIIFYTLYKLVTKQDDSPDDDAL